MNDSNDLPMTISAAANAIGVSTDRLFQWMDNHDWLVIGDLNSTVNWDEVNVTGHLSAKNGSVLVTPKGLRFLRDAIKPNRSRDELFVGSDVPFELC